MLQPQPQFFICAPAQAADEVNVAFFLEWATPNMIAKVEQAYDDANIAFAADQSKIDVIAKESGMDMETTKNQMADFGLPTKR